MTSERAGWTTPADCPIDVQTLFAAMPEAVLIISRDGRYLWTAPTTPPAQAGWDVETAARRREWLIGKSLDEVILPAFVGPAKRAIAEALDTGEVRSVEYLVDVWGRERWFAANISPLENDCVVWVARDITDLKEAVERISYQEEQYRGIFEATSEGLVINDPDTGLVLAANPAFCRIHGYDDMTGMHPTEFIHPDSHYLFEEYVTTTRAGREFRCRAQDIRLDGSVFDVEVVGRSFMYQGRPALLGLVRDVTEQVRGEQALEERVQERTRELTSLLELARQVASTVEINSLLELILDEVRVVADYDRASFAVFDGKELEVRAVRWIGEMTPGLGEGHRVQVHFGPKLWEVIQSGQPAVIGDVQDDSELSRDYRAAVGSAAIGVRSWLGIPLLSRHQVMGLLALSKAQPHYFTEHHARLARAFADQAAVALQNAELFGSLEKRTLELEGLHEVSHGVASTLDLGKVVQLIFDELGRLLQSTAISVILFEDEDIVVYDSLSADGRRSPSVGARRARDPAPTDEAASRSVFPCVEASSSPGFWNAIQRGEGVIVPDTGSPEAFAEGDYRRELARLVTSCHGVEVRSWMAVPLRGKDRVIGYLGAASDEPGHFDEEHARLARAFADHAAIAVENTRLFHRLEERTRELAILLEIAREVASTLDIESLLSLMLEEAKRVVDYHRATFFLIDGEDLVVAALVGSDVFPDENVRKDLGRRFPMRDQFLWQRVRAGQPILISDTAEDTEVAASWRSVTSTAADESLRRVRSWIGLPLVAKGQLVGLLTMSRREPGYFNERHLELAAAFGTQAAIAIDNARLFGQTQARTREMESLLEVARGVASTLDLGQLVQLLLEQLRTVIPYTGSHIMLVEGENLAVFDSRGPAGREHALIGRRIPAAGFGSVWHDLAAGRHVALDDIWNDEPRSLDFRTGAGGDDELRNHAPYVRSWLGVPLVVKDRTIGVLSASSDQAAYFNSDHIRIIRAFADHAAIAIENARLYEQAQQLAATEERQRLARELHDSVSQALYGIALGASTARDLVEDDSHPVARPLDYVLSLAEAGLAEMRALIFELRPESLQNEGLVVAITKQAEATAARYGLNVTWDPPEEPEGPLPVKEAVYRIVQEALHNVVKHARASNVSVTLTAQGDELAFEVRDDGIGFDPSDSFAGHLGLKSMRERAAALGGEIQIESGASTGTTVRCVIPVPRR